MVHDCQKRNHDRDLRRLGDGGSRSSRVKEQPHARARGPIAGFAVPTPSDSDARPVLLLMRDKSAVAARSQPRSRADDTRARLFSAAVRLFAQHGYADTTVDRIVRAAGVAKGTFFIHFATKDAVITELVRVQVHVARRAREKVLAGGGSPVEALRSAVMTLGEQAAADRELSRAVITANMLNPMLGGFAESVFGAMIAEMTDDVRAAQSARLLDPKADAVAIAGTLITSYLGAALHFATAPHSKPLMQLLVPVVDANLAGFRVASPARSKRPRPAAKTRAPRPRPAAARPTGETRQTRRS